ncbi:MAG: oxidoreductase protein, partial [Verrucomicrobiaceae bacterium]|nr:oxidoreductase protein [Verrucomicrobiaceae bacterium]
MTRRLLLASFALAASALAQQTKPLRAGIIGLDTSHAIAFTTALNTKNPPNAEGMKVVAAYPTGSPDIKSSTDRVPEYTAQAKAMGVEIVGSIPELLTKVDVVFLESNDGRVHLEQIRPCLAAKKPVFIDKPIAASLKDTLAIFAEAKQAGVPIFCSSSLRFSKQTQEVHNGSIGKVKSAETFSPAKQE